MTQLLLWAQNNSFLFIVLSLILLYLIRELLLFQLKNSKYLYYFFIYPGVVTHELGHVVGCLITFTPIKEVKLFSSTGGYVKHENPRIPLIPIFIISIMPLILGIAIIYLLSQIIDYKNLEISVKTILIMYISVSVFLSMLPSLVDVKNAFISYILITIILLAIRNDLSNFPTNGAFRAVIFMILLLSFFNILIYAFYKIRWKSE